MPYSLLITPDSSGKKYHLFTDTRFPYNVSTPLFGGIYRHSLRTQKLEGWQDILQSTVHPYVEVGSTLGNKNLHDLWTSLWKPCIILGRFCSGSSSKFPHLPTATQQNTSKTQRTRWICPRTRTALPKCLISHAINTKLHLTNSPGLQLTLWTC